MADSYKLLACIDAANNHKNEALANIRKAISLDPNNQSYQKTLNKINHMH